jgi:hypothetical protein
VPRYRQYRVYPHDEEFGFSPGFYNMGPPEPDPAAGAVIEPAELGRLRADPAFTLPMKSARGKTIVHLPPQESPPRLSADELQELVWAGQVTDYYLPEDGWSLASLRATEGYPTKKAAKEAARDMIFPDNGRGLKASFYGYAQYTWILEQPRQCVVDWAALVATYVRHETR